jgi:hypothetical protein
MSGVGAENSSGDDVTAIEAPTRMQTDCQAGVITACSGGFDNILKLGISLDTLDFEPDPYSGVLAQACNQRLAALIRRRFTVYAGNSRVYARVGVG